MRVLGINGSSSVQWLMNIADIVNDQSKSERSCIGTIWEIFSDLSIVVRGEIIITGTLQPLSQISEGTEDVVCGSFK